MEPLSDPDLFRLCCQTRPIVDLHIHLWGARISFSPVASLLRFSLSPEAILHHSLVDPLGAPLFSLSELGYMHPREINQLRQLVSQGASLFPEGTEQDFERLKKGAEHYSNYVLCHRLGSCFEVSEQFGSVYFLDRPDRFFGLPFNALLDCHWLAYQVSRSIVTDGREKQRPKD